MHIRNQNEQSEMKSKSVVFVSLMILFTTTIFITILEKNTSIVMITLLFLLSSFIILNFFFKKDLKRLFNIYYLTCVVNMFYLIFFTYYIDVFYNLEFIAVDEIGFMERSLLRFENLISSANFPIYSNSEGYEIILSWIHYLSNIFGEPHIMNARFLSIYIGSFIPVLLYRYLKENTNFKNIDWIIKVLIFFPIFNYFSIVALRDIIAATIIIAVFCIISKEKLNFVSISLLLFFLWLLSTIRFEQFTFMSIAVITLLFLKLNKYKHPIIIWIAFILLMGSVALLFSQGGFQTDNTVERYSELVTGYEDRADNIYQEDSLGLALRSLLFPLNFISVFVFGFIGGFPPWNGYSISVPQYSLLRFIQGIGNIMWLFSIPYLLIGWKFFGKKSIVKLSKEYKYSIFISIVYIFFVTTVSNDIRRFLPALFILFTFSIGVSGVKLIDRKLVFLLSYGAIIGLIIFYFVIKSI